MAAMHRSLRTAGNTPAYVSLARASAKYSTRAFRLRHSAGSHGAFVLRQTEPIGLLRSDSSLCMCATRYPRQVSDKFSSRPYSTAPKTNAGVHIQIEPLSDQCNLATITVSNPNKLNIVNSAILNELASACTTLSDDLTLRAVVLRGGQVSAGKAPSFIGGADISEMNALTTSDQARDFINRIHAVNQAIRALPVPVIARINGFALGAGLEIAMACDLRIATENSVFGMPEVQVGIPSVVEAAMLPGLIGMGRTRRMLYLAETLDASSAQQMGLVEQTVADEAELDRITDEWVKKIAGMGPQAIRAQKKLMQKWENCSVDEGVAAGVDAFASAYADGGTEPHEFMGRFLNRKK